MEQTTSIVNQAIKINNGNINVSKPNFMGSKKNTLENLKKTYPHIKIVACIPCKEQDKKFTFEQKKVYKKMLDNADYRVLISENYTPYCMQERNAFMVDNSSLVIAYLQRNYGGTANTVNYAIKKGKRVYNIVKSE